MLQIFFSFVIIPLLLFSFGVFALCKEEKFFLLLLIILIIALI